MLLKIYNNILGFFKYTCLYPIAEHKQGRCITPKLRVLQKEAKEPFTQRKARAKEQLIHTLSHAKATVPYYRELFTRCRFEPESLHKDMRYFEDIPYLTKDLLREQDRRLISEAYADKIIREQKTGSSTGLASTIYYDAESIDWTAAQNILMLAWGGKSRYHKEAHLSTRFGDIQRPVYPDPEAKKCFVLHRYNIYTSGFGNAAQEVFLQDLKDAQAHVVQGHPSSMYALAKYLQRQGRTATGLFSIFVSTGEALQEGQQELIEKTFACHVSNRYGACEFGVMAQELAKGPKNHLLVSDSMVWPELRPIEGSSGGEFIFTNLRNPAMPLIRYCMGDVGSLTENQDGWWLHDLTGRIHESVLVGEESYPTHYIQDILDRCGPISDFQIVTKEGKATELRIVTAEEHWPQVEAAVTKYFPQLAKKRINAEELIFVGIRGKFTYILRENHVSA